jgi:pSer/pThr/pTyr-binding forkhead associated (FHA) protein
MAGAFDHGSQGEDGMRSFLDACGLRESLQLVIESQTGYEDELRLLNQPFAILGRDPRADVVLDHPQVSRRHVYLQVVESQPFWLDLESRTGTRGDRDAERFGWLAGGEPLCIGPYSVRRFIGGGNDKGVQHAEVPRDAPLVARTYNRVPLPDVALEFLNGPSQSMSRPVHRVMSLIGSTSGCKFRLTDPSVSRFHACLLRTSAGLWIVDLLGQSGIFVNEEQVRFGRLVDGDSIRIGRYKIRVRCRPLRDGLRPRTSDYSRPAVFNGLPHRKRASGGLESPDWSTTPMPLLPRSAAENAAQFPVPIQADSLVPKSELMRLGTTIPGKLTQVESTESVLVPLVNQFGMMQQQMFDQFQQAIAMMVQMFGEMHRDQMKVIREELDRLHELTDELSALRTELAAHSQEPADAALRSNVKNATDTRRSVAPASTAFTLPPVSEMQTPQTWDSSNGVEAAQALQESMGSVLPTAPVRSMHQPSVKSNLSATPPFLSNPPTATSSSGTLDESSIVSQALRSGAARPGDTSRDTVLWLHQRIAAIQSEQTSRWQRILKLLPGMSS